MIERRDRPSPVQRVLAIRNRDVEMPTRSKDPEPLAYRTQRIAHVLEHVIADHEVDTGISYDCQSFSIRDDGNIDERLPR